MAKPGRPKKKKGELLILWALRIPPEVKDEIEALAPRLEKTPSELGRAFLEQGLERARRTVAAKRDG